MKSGKLYFLLGTVLLMWSAASLPVSGAIEFQEASTQFHTPVLSVQNNQNPFAQKHDDHGGAGSKYLSASDAVPHASVTSVSSLTFAVVIAIVNNDEHKPVVRVPVVPRQTVLHKVLFCSIISPNAP
jgi:hypothetical protein